MSRQTKPDGSGKNILDKPAEVRTELQKALETTEKARDKALSEPK